MATITKAAALKRVSTTAKAAHQAVLKAADAQDKRDRSILDARSASEPPTYQEIADAAGVTKDRVSQIIQDQRKRS